MANGLGSQHSFNVQTDKQRSSITVNIFEQAGVSADNLSLSTWGSSFILANLLHKLELPYPKQPVNTRDVAHAPLSSLDVLELGAGTGLVGITAAAIWRLRVLLTDLGPILPALRANMAVNKHLFPEASKPLTCAALDWNAPCTMRFHPDDGDLAGKLSPVDWKPSIILAADTLYSEDHPELVSRAILTWLAPDHRSRAVLCYPLRVAYLDEIRKFWSLMESHGLECLHEGREEADESWNEVANTPYEWCVWAWKQPN